MNTRLTGPIEGIVIQKDDVDFTSTSEGVISYKFQRHSWITDDGRLHIMVRVNEDSTPGNQALVLLSSDSIHSHLTAYTQQFGLPNTGIEEIGGVDIKSSSDGIIEDDTLYLVYNTFGGDVWLRILSYSSGSASWSQDSSNRIFTRSSDFRATKPSIAKDSAGRIWVGFMVCNYTGTNVVYESKVIYAEEDDYTNWVDSKFDTNVGLSPIDEPHRSVRLLNYSTYICAIVSDRIAFYHTYIDGPQSIINNWASKKLIYTIPEPGVPMLDPNRAHFSAIVRRVDSEYYIYFVTNNGDRSDAKIVYASYQNDNLPINAVDLPPLDLDTLGRYPQISKYANGKFYISYDIEYSNGSSGDCRGLVIIEEINENPFWAIKDQLVLPGTLCTTGPARSMTPELVADGNIPVFQQINPDEESDVQKLVIYEVPPSTE